MGHRDLRRVAGDKDEMVLAVPAAKPSKPKGVHMFRRANDEYDDAKDAHLDDNL